MEWFVNRPELGGTGGGFDEILMLSKKEAHCIGGVQSGFHLVKPSRQGGWLRIEASSRVQQPQAAGNER